MNNNSDQCGSEDHMSRVILSKLILKYRFNTTLSHAISRIFIETNNVQ